MLDFFNAVILMATLISNITLYPTQEHPIPSARESVVEVNLHREWWRDDGKGKCKYQGVMVPFVRDWEEVIQNGESGSETRLAPEPDVTAGHAFIVNRKVCGDKVEAILRVGMLHKTSGKVLFQNYFPAYDVTEMREDQLPKWYSQVIQRIERVAATDAASKEFLEFNRKAGLRVPGSTPAESPATASPVPPPAS